MQSHSRLLRPGSVASLSGIYRVTHLEHRPPHMVVAIREEVFPPCRKCRDAVRYELVEPSSYVIDDWDLAGPSLSLVS